MLRAAFEASGGRDGFISFECTPDLADDTEATIAQATELWHRLDEPNVMIKVPGTEAGLPAIEELTRRGVNVNITLLFSIERYEQVIDAYMRGLTARAAAGEPLDEIASVASFFLSRIDAKVDAQLPGDSPLRGRVAIASARVAYQRYLNKFAGPEWEHLQALGAHTQRPLWASTGTKNPAYSDVLYVSELIGPDVINTMPEQTLRAFADHGEVGARSTPTPSGERTLAEARGRGRSRRRHRGARARRRPVVLRLLPPAPRLHREQARHADARRQRPRRVASMSIADVAHSIQPCSRVLIAGGGRGPRNAVGAACAGLRSPRHHDPRARPQVHQPVDERRPAVQAPASPRRQAAGDRRRARRSLAPGTLDRVEPAYRRDHQGRRRGCLRHALSVARLACPYLSRAIYLSPSSGRRARPGHPA